MSDQSQASPRPVPAKAAQRSSSGSNKAAKAAAKYKESVEAKPKKSSGSKKQPLKVATGQKVKYPVSTSSAINGLPSPKDRRSKSTSKTTGSKKNGKTNISASRIQGSSIEMVDSNLKVKAKTPNYTQADQALAAVKIQSTAPKLRGKSKTPKRAHRGGAVAPVASNIAVSPKRPPGSGGRKPAGISMIDVPTSNLEETLKPRHSKHRRHSKPSGRRHHRYHRSSERQRSPDYIHPSLQASVRRVRLSQPIPFPPASNVPIQSSLPVQQLQPVQTYQPPQTMQQIQTMPPVQAMPAPVDQFRTVQTLPPLQLPMETVDTHGENSDRQHQLYLQTFEPQANQTMSQATTSTQPFQPQAQPKGSDADGLLIRKQDASLKNQGKDTIKTIRSQNYSGVPPDIRTSNEAPRLLNIIVHDKYTAKYSMIQLELALSRYRHSGRLCAAAFFILFIGTAIVIDYMRAGSSHLKGTLFSVDVAYDLGTISNLRKGKFGWFIMLIALVILTYIFMEFINSRTFMYVAGACLILLIVEGGLIIACSVHMKVAKPTIPSRGTKSAQPQEDPASGMRASIDTSFGQANWTAEAYTDDLVDATDVWWLVTVDPTNATTTTPTRPAGEFSTNVTVSNTTFTASRYNTTSTPKPTTIPPTTATLVVKKPTATDMTTTIIAPNTVSTRNTIVTPSTIGIPNTTSTPSTISTPKTTGTTSSVTFNSTSPFNKTDVTNTTGTNNTTEAFYSSPDGARYSLCTVLTAVLLWLIWTTVEMYLLATRIKSMSNPKTFPPDNEYVAPVDHG